VAAEGSSIAQECVEVYLFVRNPFALLLFRRPPARGRIWVPVSGKVEPSDSDWENAARRELREETGLRDWLSLLPLDWHVTFDGPDGARWRLHAYGVELGSRRTPQLSAEHEAFEWVDAHEAIRRLHYEDNQEAVRRLLRRLAERSESDVPNV
jgi:lipoyl(octanoyl) transferase